MTHMNHTEQSGQPEKSSMTDGGTPNFPIVRLGFKNRVALILHGAINYLMPKGFEDENGFHCGTSTSPDSSVSSEQ